MILYTATGTFGYVNKDEFMFVADHLLSSSVKSSIYNRLKNSLSYFYLGFFPIQRNLHCEFPNYPNWYYHILPVAHLNPLFGFLQYKDHLQQAFFQLCTPLL